MPHERLKPSFTIDKDRLEELKRMVPEAFADGQINWESLKEALGEYLEDDGPDSEHFGLFWPGKRQARKIASIPSKGTLVPVYGDGLKADGTPDSDGHNDSHNIFIEGENLEVLKILQKSYAGRIKMIYIDPPYNTGNDFVYEDDFKEPLQEYLRRTGQVDEEGRPLTTNTRADGRFHSKWLSMIYPRLRLARNLLRDDGVIFVSIDDNEVHHLRNLMDEVFGGENFVGILTWLKKRKGSFLSKEMISLTEYCIIYKKSDEFGYLFGGKPDESESQPLIKRTNSVAKLQIPQKTVSTKLENGVYKAGIYGEGSSSIKLLNDIKIKDGIIESAFEIEGPFIWTQKYLNEQLSKGAKLIVNTKNFQIRAFKSQEEDAFKGLPSIVIGTEISGTNEDAYEDLLNLFDENKVFDYSKPVNYLKYLINSSTYFDSDSIVLDFFAGSGTLGHAIFEYNIENTTNLQFIAVQLDEVIDDEKIKNLGYNKISSVAKERLIRVVKKLDIKNNESFDAGFKNLKLAKSHYKDWQNYQGSDIKQLEMRFEEFSSPLVDNWKKENLLTEIILIEGFPLDSDIEEVKNIKTNGINQVTSTFHEHRLFICLDKKIAGETIQQLKLSGDDVFICLDSAITDQDKVRLADKGMIKTI